MMAEKGLGKKEQFPNSKIFSAEAKIGPVLKGKLEKNFLKEQRRLDEKMGMHILDTNFERLSSQPSFTCLVGSVTFSAF